MAGFNSECKASSACTQHIPEIWLLSRSASRAQHWLTPLGAKGEIREQQRDSAFLTKKPSNPAHLRLTPGQFCTGMVSKARQCQVRSLQDSSHVFSKSNLKRLEGKKKKDLSDVTFTGGIRFAVGRDARTQHPQCHNLLIKQCHKLELSSRIQPIFEASHLLLHP